MSNTIAETKAQISANQYIGNLPNRDMNVVLTLYTRLSLYDKLRNTHHKNLVSVYSIKTIYQPRMVMKEVTYVMIVQFLISIY